MSAFDLSTKALEYRRIAQGCEDPFIRELLLELAASCEELAKEQAAEGNDNASEGDAEP